VIFYGDPRYVAFLPFDVGDGIGNGIFPRPARLGLNHYKDKLRSYCDKGDPICDSGGLNFFVHHTYDQRWNTHAASWVIKKLTEEEEE
jgi:hypothetical protein